VQVTPSDSTPDLECTDKAWAAIACGDLRASEAARFGLVRCGSPASARLLDTLAWGPVPFCGEYF
jgi:hypothetical protein